MGIDMSFFGDKGYIDIHSHIIHCVDDGSPSLSASLELINLAYDEGIRTMIATPHFGFINPAYSKEKALENFDILVREIKKTKPDMRLYFGNEIFLAPGYADGLADGMSEGLAGSRYALVEFPDIANYDMAYHLLESVKDKGYIPVIAHAERYIRVYKNIKGLNTLIDKGALVQVNTNTIGSIDLNRNFFKRLSSFSSEQEKREKLICEMLKEGMVHFVSTDCHYIHGRKPAMKKAAGVLKELIGQNAAEELLIGNPMRIIEGQY